MPDSVAKCTFQLRLPLPSVKNAQDACRVAAVNSSGTFPAHCTHRSPSFAKVWGQGFWQAMTFYDSTLCLQYPFLLHLCLLIPRMMYVHSWACAGTPQRIPYQRAYQAGAPQLPLTHPICPFSLCQHACIIYNKPSLCSPHTQHWPTWRPCYVGNWAFGTSSQPV